VEENRANFCKGLDGKPLLEYMVTPNELKAVLKVSAWRGHSGIVNKTSVESMGQDDFQEVKRSKTHISNNTSQTAKKSNKPVPISPALNLPPKAVLTRNFLTPLRTTDMDMENAGAENTLPEQEAP
jgi:hypothetical protein